MSGTSGGRFPWFTATCVALILTGLAHLGAASKPPSAAENEINQRLGAIVMELPGGNKTALQILTGFGHFFTASCVAMGVAGIAAMRVRPRSVPTVRAMAVVYLLGGIAFTILSVVYWFIIPTALLGVTTLLCAVSVFCDGRGAGAAGVHA